MRELLAVALVAALAAAGVAFEALVDPAPAARPPSAPAAFVQRAVYCPPPLRGGASRTNVAIAATGGGSVPVRFEPGSTGTRLRQGRLLEREVSSLSGSSVTGYGAHLAASAWSSLTPPLTGAGAATCSEVASESWFFAEGSSALGTDQRLLVHNPFLDEAVLRVVFHTTEGASAKASLADVAVPPGLSVELAANDFVLRENLLATSVLVTRGRVVAWRELLPAKGRGSGMQMTLGAPAPAKTWYFPYGRVGRGYDERIAVLNPTPQEAVVTITLATDERVRQPPRLVELAIPPHSSRRVSLADDAAGPKEPIEVGAWVTAVNGVPVVAERTVASSRADLEGITAEVGVAGGARRWALGPAVARPTEDSVELLNPGHGDASVTLTLVTNDEEPLAPSALAGIEVPAGLRISVDIARWTAAETFGVVVAADRSVIAERWSYGRRSSDAAAVMGVPIRPSEPR